MRSHRQDHGIVAMSLLAPIVAAVIGGAAAIGAAVQIVHLAPGSSSSSTTPAGTTNSVDYGNR